MASSIKPQLTQVQENIIKNFTEKYKGYQLEYTNPRDYKGHDESKKETEKFLREAAQKIVAKEAEQKTVSFLSMLAAPFKPIMSFFGYKDKSTKILDQKIAQQMTEDVSLNMKEKIVVCKVGDNLSIKVYGKEASSCNQRIGFSPSDDRKPLCGANTSMNYSFDAKGNNLTATVGASQGTVQYVK